MKMKHLYITLLVCFSSTFAIGQESKFEQLGQFLDSLAAKNKFMGVLLIADQGKPVFQKAVGWADVSVGKPMEVNSKLRVGSVTKMMTTVLIFKAIEAKKLSLDQKLADFYPQIKNADKVSISHLLQHRSGIFNFTNRLDYNIFRSNPHTEEQLLAMMIEGGSIFEPDSKADYSNSNFVLLTFILEKVYGMPYQKLLQDQILTPLGMKDTSVFGKIAVEKGETKSYLYNGKWVEDQEAHYTVPLGAGAISSTVSDLNVFISALFEGELISKESLESMKDLRDGYGRGLFSFPYYERKSFGHTGGIDGFRAFLAYFPEENVTLAVLSNGMNYNNNDILLAALNSRFGREWKLPDLTERVISEELMHKYTGTYTSTQIPLQLTVENVGGKVAIQLTGQPQSVLEATAAHTFELKAVGAVFIFDLDQSQVTLKQGPASILFKKK
jgi:D-alanyl-D-alanine carboxypeptidase